MQRYSWLITWLAAFMVISAAHTTLSPEWRRRFDWLLVVVFSAAAVWKLGKWTREQRGAWLVNLRARFVSLGKQEVSGREMVVALAVMGGVFFVANRLTPQQERWFYPLGAAPLACYVAVTLWMERARKVAGFVTEDTLKPVTEETVKPLSVKRVLALVGLAVFVALTAVAVGFVAGVTRH